MSRTLADYQRTLPLPKPLSDYIQYVLDFPNGDRSILEGYPEGRAFLLELALERRKIPLSTRRAPMLVGKAMRETIDRVAMEAFGHKGMAE